MILAGRERLTATAASALPNSPMPATCRWWACRVRAASTIRRSAHSRRCWRRRIASCCSASAPTSPSSSAPRRRSPPAASSCRSTPDASEIERARQLPGGRPALQSQADTDAATDALLARGARRPPARRSGWRAEVAGCDRLPARRMGPGAGRRRQAASSGAGVPLVSGAAGQPSRGGAGLRRRRDRPVGAGLPACAPPGRQRAGRRDRRRRAVRAGGEPRPARTRRWSRSWATAASAFTSPSTTRRSATAFPSSAWSATMHAGTPNTRSSSPTTAPNAPSAASCDRHGTMRWSPPSAAMASWWRMPPPSRRRRARACQRLPACVNIMIEGVAAPVVRR